MAKELPRQTKIVATLGPASSSFEEIESLFLAGANVFRLNFSHGSYEEHQARYDNIRKIEDKHNVPISVIADMQGPKLRVGTFTRQDIVLKEGQEFILDSNTEDGDENRVYLPHPEIITAVKKGDNLLINDGNITLEVLNKDDKSIRTKVVFGGEISDHKGLNLPNTILPLESLTEKDKKDLEYAIKMGVDWIALSFVQTSQDIKQAQEIIKGRCPIIAKIEKPSALTHIDEIVRLSDALMVARGDLGVEIPVENVPMVQKKLITKARKAAKPVIIATQMLESMVVHPTPTRAEATDIATAVYDGADAIMLSAETASGMYPVKAVETMAKTAKRIESDSLYKEERDSHAINPKHDKEDVIAYSAYKTTLRLDSSVIATFTVSGLTTLLASRERPHVPILSLTTKQETARKMMLSFGVYSYVVDLLDNFEDMQKEVLKIVKEHNYASIGENVVVTASYPLEEIGKTNLMYILTVE